MQIGIDAFTLRNLNLAPRDLLDHVVGMGLAGVQFGSMTELNRELCKTELCDIHAHARQRNLYVHVGVPSPNPHITRQRPASLI